MYTWPHKQGIGVRLSYGVHGNGIVSKRKENESSQTPFEMKYPRLTNDSDSLAVVKDSEQELVKGNKRDSKPNHIDKQERSVSEKFGSNYIPQGIVKSFLSESSILSSDIVYDPNLGSLLQLFRLENDIAMVYATGESRTVLSISKIESNEMVLSNTNLLQISFKDAIQQIQIGNNSTGTILLIRTNFKISVLLLSRSTDNLFKIKTLGETTSEALNNATFADTSFCIHKAGVFGVVDIKGNFQIWKINKSLTLTKMLTYTQDVKFDDDLSNWRRICWISTNVILILSRTKVMKYSMMSNKEIISKQIVTADTWSRIWDYKIVDESNMFLLTSKEIIWIDIKNKFEKKLSWKHFLSDSDPSMKLELLNINSQVFICTIYSQISPLLIFYTFGFDGNYPVILNNPYYIRRSSSVKFLKQVALIERGNMVILLEQDTDSSIKARLLHKSGHDEKIEEKYENNTVLEKVKFNSTNSYLNDIYTSISKTPKFNDITDLHTFASHLNANINQLRPNGIKEYSLYELNEKIPILEDILELDDMIAQLQDMLPNTAHLKSLINNSFIQKMKYSNEKTTKTHINDIKSKLDDAFGSSHNNSFMATYLGTSLIKINFESNELQNKYDQALQDAPDFVKDLIEGWNDYEEHQNEDTTDTQIEFQTQAFSMPSLKASQSSTPRPNLPSQNSQTIHSQPQSSNNKPSQLSSQRSLNKSSQITKRRKKKGGFA